MSDWKGRFKGGLHPEALAFSTSLGVDRRLVEEDITGSLAHVRMLAKQRIIPAADAKKIQRALEQLLGEYRRTGPPTQKGVAGKDRFVAEDIHMAVEARLIAKVGDVGKRLHTARSRNDQVALDERLYLRTTIIRMLAAVTGLQQVLVGQAKAHESVLMPGYTHLQRAQPILLAHHLLAYTEMLDRDKSRFSSCLGRAARSPLGACALAGSSFPVDRRKVARDLGFDGIVENSIDAVADRDALIEFIAAASITMMHLSRMAEEMVLWSSREWSFLEFDDAFATGSSIMPQKKNPDMAELVRGKTGRVYGDLVALLTVMKGLPLAYNRDMQEDKEPLFDAADTTIASLRIMAMALQSARFAASRFEKELEMDFSTATDFADYLVRKGLPFRSAHAVVGSMVRCCVEQGTTLADLTPEDLKAISPLFGDEAVRLAQPRLSVAAKRSAGATSPKEVRRAIVRWQRRLS